MGEEAFMKTVKKAQALLLGTCYDPEKWDSEVQKEDLRRMQEAGIEMISPEKGENDSDGRMQSEPKPGQLMLSAMEQIGHGADRVSLLRWRKARTGEEIYEPAILDRDNRDNRKLAELKKIRCRLEAIGEVAGTECYAAAAVLQDEENLKDMQSDRRHRELAEESERAIFAAAKRTHTPAAKVKLTVETGAESLLRYPVLFFSHPMILTERNVAVLTEYVKRGGCLIVGALAGLKDEAGQCVTAPGPGALRELTGTEVREGTFVASNEKAYLDFDGQRIDTGVYNEILEVSAEDTRVLEEYAGSYYSGEPALTEHKVGEGKVIHFGGTFTQALAESLLAYTGVRRPLGELIWLPGDCELCVREKEDAMWLFVLNHSNEERSILLKVTGTDVDTGKAAEGESTLAAYETKVYKIAIVREYQSEQLLPWQE